MAACFFENYITEEGRQLRQSLGPSMTIEEYLAEAERFRILKTQAGDSFNQHLFAQIERSYRTLAECDALLKGIPERTT